MARWMKSSQQVYDPLGLGRSWTTEWNEKCRMELYLVHINYSEEGTRK